ncbi:hypothetical protein [uncultured Pseudoteredinibacter sp.]|uniref:hypothetical protein n=1 Tax=uncultured Pseudoteredinibacter sp. TaxID=1641701 RepID=UPI00263038B1|nr:hypothetical protein [uncultured Pseudoteredinibacter sp.]
MDQRKLFFYLTRLDKHLQHARKTYDLVSLSDLSHSLRIWTEIIEDLESSFEPVKLKKPFKHQSPARKFSKAIKRHEHVVCYMEGGVKVFCAKGEVLSDEPIPDGVDFSISGKFATSDKEGWADMHSYYRVMGTTLSEGENHSFNSPKSKRLLFREWMNAEICRVQFSAPSGQLDSLQISRTNLIKRVANSFGGSHAHPTEQEDNGNRFDKPISRLMNTCLLGLPLPYFLLVHTGHLITENIPQILDLKRTHAQY